MGVGGGVGAWRLSWQSAWRNPGRPGFYLQHCWLQNSGCGVGGSVIQGHPQLQQVPGQPRLHDTLTKNSIQARMFYLSIESQLITI